jgi:hypothetical protein
MSQENIEIARPFHDHFDRTGRRKRRRSHLLWNVRCGRGMIACEGPGSPRPVNSALRPDPIPADGRRTGSADAA